MGQYHEWNMTIDNVKQQQKNNMLLSERSTTNKLNSILNFKHLLNGFDTS